MNKELEIANKKNEYGCKICGVNEAVVKLESGSFNIYGSFCQPCAVTRLEKYYCWNEEMEKRIRLERGLNLMEAEKYLESKGNINN